MSIAVCLCRNVYLGLLPIFQLGFLLFCSVWLDFAINPILKRWDSRHREDKVNLWFTLPLHLNLSRTPQEQMPLSSMMKNGVTLPFPGPSVCTCWRCGKANQGGRRGRLEMQEERRNEMFQLIDTAEGRCYFFKPSLPCLPERSCWRNRRQQLPAPLPTPALC